MRITPAEQRAERVRAGDEEQLGVRALGMQIAKRVDVPIIASGGAGKKEDFLDLFQYPQIDAGLAASIFHRKEVNIKELKQYLAENGVEMRLI